jgi:quercetin dioxygenase-like cupin family protein
MQSNPKTASANIMDGHANAAIFGPGGLVHSDQLRLGVSLLAPHVRHPDHFHSPDEVYLMISEGEFQQGDGDWFQPGFGGVLYNEPNIVHAMRSGPRPLLAFWALGS